jgi:hypothetical protein
MPIIHPKSVSLQRYADRACEPANARRVARHLERCARCRDIVMFNRTIGEQSRALASATASDALLQRILANRNAGLRVILPVESGSHVHRPLPRYSSLVAIAGLAAATVIAVIGYRASHANAVVFGRMTALFTFTGFVATEAEAAPVIQGSATLLAVRSLAPMSLSFRREWVSNQNPSHREVDGTADFSVAPRMLDGQPVWLITTTWTGLSGEADVDNARTEAESVYVTRSTLQPLSRTVHVTPYRRFTGINIAQRFVGDSITGQMTLTASSTRRPIAGNLTSSHGRLVPSDALGPVFFQGVPLREGWRADLDLLGWAVVHDDIVHPFAVRVVGSERVTVPAGSFDCWKMSISALGRTSLAWVRKSDHIGVLARNVTPDGRIRDVVLVSESQLSPE